MTTTTIRSAVAAAFAAIALVAGAQDPAVANLLEIYGDKSSLTPQQKLPMLRLLVKKHPDSAELAELLAKVEAAAEQDGSIANDSAKAEPDPDKAAPAEAPAKKAPAPAKVTKVTKVTKVWTTPPPWLVLDVATGKMEGYDFPVEKAVRVFNDPKYKTGKMVFRFIPKGLYCVRDSRRTKAEMERDFYIAIFEMTNGQYERMVNPSKEASQWSDDDLKPCQSIPWRMMRGTDKGPVSKQLGKHVLWDYKQRTGVALDLPTVSMWEVAARAAKAGDTSRAEWQWFFGAKGDKISEYAWRKGNSKGKPQIVGSLKPNQWGLFDVYGNVWEWCLDGEDSWVLSQDPEWDEAGFKRRCCGGGIDKTDPESFTSTSCALANPVASYDEIGYRFVIFARHALSKRPVEIQEISEEVVAPVSDTLEPGAVKPEPAEEEKPEPAVAKPEPAEEEKPEPAAVKPEPAEEEKPEPAVAKPEPAEEGKPEPAAVKPEPAEEEKPEPAVAKPEPAATKPTSTPPASKPSSEKLKSGVERILLLPGGAKMTMIYCEPGEYTMGRAYANDGDISESPIQVTLTKGFWLSKYETTQDQWQGVMGSNPSKEEFRGGDVPVHNVSWNDVQEFIRKVESENGGCGARLPTEAEWEYACRAGSTTFYPWGDSLNGDRANVRGIEPFGTGEEGPCLYKPSPVGMYPPNAWGFCDTIGNVGEWCQDWYQNRDRKTPKSMVDPVGLATGKSRSIRGGSFEERAQYARACSRSAGNPDTRGVRVGFRLACNEVPEGVQPDADVEVPPAPEGLKTGATKKVVLPGGAEMEMIYCAPGSFMMGGTMDEFFSLSYNGKDSFKNSELPRHRVVITKGFWMAKYELTQAQWKSVMGEESRVYEYLKANVDFVGDEYPMGCISWDSANELIKEINKEGKIAVRLPTEAEWEYACRAGTTTPFPWGDTCNGTEANCNGEEPYPYKKGTPGPNLKKATPVGKYPANQWGFCDMAGNMEEWCQDWHYYYPWTLRTQVDPVVREKVYSVIRTIRGGSYKSPAENCRSSFRSYAVPGSTFAYNYGLRLVIEEGAAAKAPEGNKAGSTAAAAADAADAAATSDAAAASNAAVASDAAVAAKTKAIALPGGATMEMIYCPPGTYMMGSREDSPCKDSNDVCPQIKVTLTKGFWLGKYEVTQAQWKSVMGSNPSDEESLGDDLPVNNMSWDDAVAFAKKVGGGARLPTDAEWEYACKAGTDTVFHWGDTCNGTEANCNGTKPFGTDKKGPNIDHAVKVGSYPPNAWGFHDMGGNVAEWCSDRHKDYYIVHPKELTDPQGGDSSVRYRTVRGGCFYSYWRAVDCRSVKRDLCPPDETRAYVGFRLAMDE